MAVSQDLSAWVQLPYNAADFSASGAGWTVDRGDVLALAIAKWGHTACLSFSLIETTLSGAGGVELRINLPPGFAVRRRGENLFRWTDAGAGHVGSLYVEPGIDYVRMRQLTHGTPFPASSDLDVTGQLLFEVW